MRRENLPATIAGRLRRRIVQGELPPGTQLPGHRELAASFSVSVGSVREAISMLISEGLIETRAGRGTYIVDGGNLPHALTDGAPLGLTEYDLGREELVDAVETARARWLLTATRLLRVPREG